MGLIYILKKQFKSCAAYDRTPFTIAPATNEDQDSFAEICFFYAIKSLHNVNYCLHFAYLCKI